MTSQLCWTDGQFLQDCFANLPGSIFAHRTLGQMYLDEEEYQNAISVAEKGLQLVRKFEADLGKPLDK